MKKVKTNSVYVVMCNDRPVSASLDFAAAKKEVKWLTEGAERARLRDGIEMVGVFYIDEVPLLKEDA